MESNLKLPNNADVDTFAKTNITDFVTSGDEILICSDFEGVLPEKQLKYFENVFTTGKTNNLDLDNQTSKIIYLGDIFDNTGCIKFKDFKPTNYCALKTLKYLVDYPERSRYVVGNRDINKIKLVPLLQFKDLNDKWWDFNPEVESQSIYIDIVSNLIIKNNEANKINNSIWNVETMELYRPFWTSKSKDYLKWFDDSVDSVNIKPMITLHDRFQRIFGVDTTTGTMSADNSLIGIPNELFSDSINVIITEIKNIILSSFDSPIDEKVENEIRSGIVFTVFMRMLMLEKPTNTVKTDKTNFSLNKKGDLDGYLKYYLSNAPPALYAENNKDNILLFSHGGITNEFVDSTKEGNGLTILRQFDDAKWAEVLNSKIPNPKKIESKSIDDQYQMQKSIIPKIQSYNEEYFTILYQCFSNFNNTNFNKELMILLSISAPAENNEVLGFSYSTSNLSPIQPRLPADSVLSTQGSSTKIFNFCGHGSSGNGYGLKKITENMYFINTDLVASIFKLGICDDNYNTNYLLLTISFNKPNNKFDIHLSGSYELNKKFTKIDPTDNINQITDLGDINEKFKIEKLEGPNQKLPYADIAAAYIDDKYTPITTPIKLVINYSGSFGGSDVTMNDKFFKDKFKLQNYYIYNGEVTANYNGIEKKYDLYSYYRIVPPPPIKINRNLLIFYELESQKPSNRTNIGNLNLGNSGNSGNSGNLNVGGYRKKRSNYKSVKKNRKYKTKGKLFKKNSTRNKKLKSKKH